MFRPLLMALCFSPTLLLAHPPSVETVQTLVARIKTVLPEGWAVSYDAADRWLEVRREGKVAGRQVAVSDTAIREPETLEYQFALRVAPAMSPEEFSQLTAENAKVAQEASRLEDQLEKLGLRPQKGGKYDAQTEEQRALVMQLEVVKQKWTLPPDFYFENISLTKTKSLPIALEDDKLQQECDGVKARVEGLLQRYVPKEDCRGRHFPHGRDTSGLLKRRDVSPAPCHCASQRRVVCRGADAGGVAGAAATDRKIL